MAFKFAPPVKTLLKGDNAAYHIRFAKNQLAILERQMSFQGLNEGRRVVSPYDGVTVECLSSFGRKEVRIHVAEGFLFGQQESHQQQREKKKFTTRCDCFPFFSLGVITKVTPEVPVKLEAETDTQFASRMGVYEAFLIDGRFKYDIVICNATTYIECTDVLDANFGRYYNGQLVLATAGTLTDPSGIEIDCDRSCLLGSPIIEVLMISPLHIMEGMSKKTKFIEL